VKHKRPHAGSSHVSNGHHARSIYPKSKHEPYGSLDLGYLSRRRFVVSGSPLDDCWDTDPTINGRRRVDDGFVLSVFLLA
jgi:hypothetical protein